MRPLLAGASLAALLLPAGLEAYSGIGRAAVERALGRVPESRDELERLVDELEARRTGGEASAELLYTLAVLRLNRPTGYNLDGPRRILGAAVVADPGFKDALALWLDLVPPEAELREAEAGLRAGREGGEGSEGARRWALANVLHQLGSDGEAGSEAEAAVRADPAFAARAHWLQAQLAGERKDDEAATSSFQRALDALDEPAAELIWASTLLVATPEERARHGKTQSEDRRDFLLSAWKRRDVFPLTERNERLGEHFRRVRKARGDYALASNGRAYLSTHDTFKELSPDLPFYSSEVVFEYQDRAGVWLDHRGLVFVRHGEPDRQVRTSTGSRAESWLYFRFSFKPLLFHFVDRTGVGEFVFALNLAQATTTTVVEDDPKVVLVHAGDFRDLYGTRAAFHPLFQRVALSRSRYEIEDLLVQEAGLMGSFLREAFYDDTNSLIDKKDLLPFAAYSANFRAAPGDRVDAFVYYAVPERELKLPGGSFDFDATIVLYSHNWSERLASADHHFTYERPAGRKPSKEDLLVGVLELKGLRPDRYNFAFQVTERRTGKIGIAKGKLIVDYFGEPWVDLSDLLLATDVTRSERATVFERHGQKVVPIPTRTVKKGSGAEIYYEIYDLARGEDGQHHYRVEHRILQIQEEPSVAEKIFGVGMNIASVFFPYEIFLARAGLFGLGVAAQDPDEGLETLVDERNAPAPGADVVAETFTLDTKKYSPGIYQLYVTVKDYVTGSLSTRSIRFAVTN